MMITGRNYGVCSQQERPLKYRGKNNGRVLSGKMCLHCDKTDSGREKI
jgi:hypothetical protein